MHLTLSSNEVYSIGGYDGIPEYHAIFRSDKRIDFTDKCANKCFT